uniref:Uncharacterized protein n=1 Tax=Cyprinus carpio TaxID=7962 RepID=A0A8C1WQ43_CYPCA
MLKRLRSESLEPSGVSVKSNASMMDPTALSEATVTSDPRLSGCMVTDEGCVFLSSALISNPSHLRELDLSYNHPGDSGVKLLNQKLQDPTYKLQILNFHEEREKNTGSKMSSPSSESSCDQPMKNLPFAITDATVTDPSMWKTLRSESPEPSGVSVKSNASMMDPPALSEATVTSEPTMWKRMRSKSPEPSGVSVKSNASMMDPPALSEATVTSDPRYGTRYFLHLSDSFIQTTYCAFQQPTHTRTHKTHFPDPSLFLAIE